MASLSTSVCSPTVRIIAFQAIDPGSTPGKRKGLVLPNFIMSLCNSTSANVQCTILYPITLFLIITINQLLIVLIFP